MKINTLLLLSLTALAPLAYARAQEPATEGYDRSSISVITVLRGDAYDDEALQAVKSYPLSAQFDLNRIPLTTVRLRKDRSLPLTRLEADSLLSSHGVAKQLLSFLFNRREDGSSDDSLLLARGAYNATDQDILNARAAKVGLERFVQGERLLSSVYVILLDFSEISFDAMGEGSCAATTVAYPYRLDLSRDKLEEFYTKAWADRNASAEEKRRAREGFEAFQTGLLPQQPTGDQLLVFQDEGGGLLTTALRSGIRNAFGGLAKSNDTWQLAASVLSTKPLAVKIGKKEGVTNRRRFRTYSYREDEQGNLHTVPRGYIRATQVSDNLGEATGDTQPSLFYQISGVKNVEEGWTVKEARNAGIGLQLGVSSGGASGGLSANLGLDFLLHIGKGGGIWYALAEAGVDPKVFSANKGAEDGLQAFGARGALGAAYGLPLTRFFELAPYLMAGADVLNFQEDGTEKMEGSSWAPFVQPGARLSAKVWYPLSFFVRGGYDLLLRSTAEDTPYGKINSLLEKPHTSGLVLQAGLKYEF